VLSIGIEIGDLAQSGEFALFHRIRYGMGGAENARLENAGTSFYGKPRMSFIWFADAYQLWPNCAFLPPPPVNIRRGVAEMSV